MASFDLAITYVLGNEKGLEESPHDPGGITNYGISLRFLKCLSPAELKNASIFTDTIDEDTIRTLSIEQAKSVYKNQFWSVAPFSEILSQVVCNYIFDMAVNMGVGPAIKCAQRALWAYAENRDIMCDDGVLGPRTIALLNQFNFSILPAIRSERAGEYRLIANEDPCERVFLDGWLNRAYGTK